MVTDGVFKSIACTSLHDQTPPAPADLLDLPVKVGGVTRDHGHSGDRRQALGSQRLMVVKEAHRAAGLGDQDRRVSLLGGASL